MEEEFLASGGKIQKFKLGNLFTFSSIKQSKSQKNIPVDNSIDGVNYIVQSMFNNMFSRKVNRQYLIENDEVPISGNKIVLGVTLPAVSYQPEEFGASQVIVAEADWLNSKNGLFIVASIEKLMYLFSYSNKPGLKIYKSMEVDLPATKGNQLDFAYMEKFITELQAERLQELQAERLQELQGYLQVTGLSNYTLTEEEQRAIDDLDNIKWGTFNIEKLFGKATRGKRLKSADRISGDLPFVTAGENDTGISAFIGNDVEVFKANTITIDMFGSAKYRNYQYGADDHIAVVHCDKLAKESVLFLTSAIHKVSNAGQFSYAKNFYAKDANELNISLPTKNNVPDYALMKTLGSAIQKLVIADVVKYADRELSAYQSVIGE
ncbi:restriction endonuclease subunit S [Haemophilus influenzae]|uniref:restriction endonuclease subunit S n=1 Tax=Haemophilus influenzae TaxID=727 RepID=UPI001F0775FD|nr:restriction endonuclease subunit S [Haemophilus influenzae]